MSTQFQSIPYDRLEVGMTASQSRLCRENDFYVFANASGDMNPLHMPHVDDDDGSTATAPGMWVASLISAVFGNKLPGPDTLYHSQTLRFLRRVRAGETVTATVRLTAKEPGRLARFDTWVDNAAGERIVEGDAAVIAPAQARAYAIDDVPGLTVRRHAHFDDLIDAARPLPPLRTAVVAPEERDALTGPLLAAEHALIEPVLVGDADKIRAEAAEHGLDVAGLEIVHEPAHRAAAARAVSLAREGAVDALMKGHLHTDVFLSEIVRKDAGLRGDRRISHAFVMDVPGLEQPLMITDAAINIAPDLRTKADIVQNAIDLALALRVERPRVGVLAAVETVNPAIPSTLDAALLSKMAERGQIKGGVVDGPLAMDNAVDLNAARTKGIHSTVAGQAQILVAPNLDAGNMIAKQLTYLAHAEAAGLVLGCRRPVILTSRADGPKARLASCALAVLANAGADGAQAVSTQA
ncbi:MAG: bifunctional enoyl-CoA hydratase/phosphate acetyltransferase [Pseudomonadota bacterium]